MSKHLFKGTGVAVVTPFTESFAVDYPSLEKIVDFQVNGGVDYVVIMGTTAESPTINQEEKKKIVECISGIVNNRVPLVLGIGGNNTGAVTDLIKQTNFDGIDGILSVSPCYNKPTQDGMYAHFKEIAKICPVPIILYNVPGRTSSNMLPATSLKLAHEFKNIAAIKEASGNLNQAAEIIKDKPEHFIVVSGDDALTLPMISLGGSGVISVVANAFPKEFSQLVSEALKGNYEKAREIHYQLIDIIQLLFVDGNPAGIKAAMHLKGLLSNNLRLPLVPVSKKTYEQLSQNIKL